MRTGEKGENMMFIVGVIIVIFGAIGVLGGELGGGVLFIAVGAFFIFLSKKQTKKSKQPTVQTESQPFSRINVAGHYYHKDQIEDILTLNPKLPKGTKGSEGDIVYRYAYFEKPCLLVPEPDNPADSNAIKVECDGKTIGYVSKEDTSSIHPLIQKESIHPMLTIRRGPYLIFEDGEWKYRDDEYSVFVTLM